jgi:hypothetical protein
MGGASTGGGGTQHGWGGAGAARRSIPRAASGVGTGRGGTGERSTSRVSEDAQRRVGKVRGWVDEDEPRMDRSHGTRP